jgi:formiminoglutamase
MSYTEIKNYINSVNSQSINAANYSPRQLGAYLQPENTEEQFDNAQVILIGCGETRGEHPNSKPNNGADIVRYHLYELYYWHPTVKIFDLGNIKSGNTLADTRAALLTVLELLNKEGKIAILVGGSHDLTFTQYQTFVRNKQIIDATVLDMVIDLKDEEAILHDNFLFEMLTSSPSYVRNFSLMGFQSFATNPEIVETLDKLHFDCMRLGKLREKLDSIEPILRHSDMISIDMNVVKNSDAPCNTAGSPNGLHGDEICKVTRFAGLSDKCCSLGIYGYNPEVDTHELSAKLIAQMIWYFIDGVYAKMQEAPLSDKAQFLEYNVMVNGAYTLFIKSKSTNRWWVQLPDKSFYPCSYDDYKTASNGLIPEVWMKELNRGVE